MIQVLALHGISISFSELGKLFEEALGSLWSRDWGIHPPSLGPWPLHVILMLFWFPRAAPSFSGASLVLSCH